MTVTIGASATSSIGTPINKKTTAKFRVERKPPPAAPQSSGGGSVRIGSGGSGGGGSWAAVERYYLRAHELHADRRLGDVDPAPAAARADATSRRSGSTPGSRPRVSRPYAAAPRDQRRTAATSSAAARTTGCAAPATRATTGARTSAAAAATRTRPSSARTSSTRARGRTTAATTVNLMNADLRPGRDRRLGVGRPGPPRHRLLPPLTPDHRGR